MEYIREGIRTAGRDSIQESGEKDNQTTDGVEIQTNKLHAKLGHPREYSIRATAKHLHYTIIRTIEVCEDCNLEKIKKKLLRKLAEERELNTVEIIYIDISSQKNPSHGGSK